MKNKIYKIIFAILGFIALVFVIRSYGLEKIVSEFSSLGLFALIVLALSFVPTLICYSMAWLLCSDHLKFNLKNIFAFSKMSSASIAWNNLTPFLKIGGEPAKVFMLEKLISRKSALKSVVIYNLIHTIATVWAIGLAALLLPFLFPLSSAISKVSIIMGLAVFIISALIFLILKAKNNLNTSKLGFLRKPIVYIMWSFSKLRVFAKNNSDKFALAIFIEIFARYIEGITFYFAFYFINQKIPLLTSLFLEVGRALFDSIFFFIPYQMGAREGALGFFLSAIGANSQTANSNLNAGGAGYVTASFLYRFVEIIWIFFGYFIWLFNSNKRKAAPNKN